MGTMTFEIGRYYHVQIGNDWFIALYKENGYFDVLSGNYRIDQVDWEWDEFDDIDNDPITRKLKPTAKEDEVDIRVGGC